MSRTLRPARSRTFRAAFAGAVVNHSGSWATVFVQDVYQGLLQQGVILAVPVQLFGNVPESVIAALNGIGLLVERLLPNLPLQPGQQPPLPDEFHHEVGNGREGMVLSPAEVPDLPLLERNELLPAARPRVVEPDRHRLSED